MFLKRQITFLFLVLFLTGIFLAFYAPANASRPVPYPDANNSIQRAEIPSVPDTRMDPATTVPNTLAYSTFFGGSVQDRVTDMITGNDGSIYLIGDSDSPETWAIPNTTHIGPTGGKDIFVLKLNASGTAILYAALIGGSGGESGNAITVDNTGNVYITGTTGSQDFPATPGTFDVTCDTFICSDVIVAKLNPSGTGLLFATYLGGNGFDYGYDIEVDALGNIYIGGFCGYGFFPTTANAFDPTYNGGQSIHNMGDGFVAKLSPNGSSLIYSTYLGGSQADSLNAMAVTSDGSVVVTGSTRSYNFPTTPGAYDTTCGTDGDCNETSTSLGYGGPADVFVTKIAPSGSYLIYSTFVGSSLIESGNNIVLGVDGSAYVVGETGSTYFPTTTNAADRSYNGGNKDAFLLRLNNSGSALLYSSFLGGTGDDQAKSVQVSADGFMYAAGTTNSANFPTTGNAYDSFYNGEKDAFLTVFDPNTVSLFNSTFLGGSANDEALSLLLTANDEAVVSGFTYSPDYPTSADAHDGQCGTDGTCNNAGSPKSDGFFTILGVEPSWTLMYYFATDNDTVPWLSIYLGGLQDSINNPNVNVALFYDTPQNNPVYHGLAWHNGIYEPFNHEASTGAASTLSDFIQWSQLNYPADHYALILFDHGVGLTGFGFDDHPALDTQDCPGGTACLTQQELRQALSGINPIDVLFIHACSMGNMETLWQLRDQVDYVVASEQLAWPDAGHRNYIMGGGEIPPIGQQTTPQDLAVNMAKNYAASIQRAHTISVVKMSELNNVADKTSQLAALLILGMNQNPVLAELLEDIRLEVQHFTTEGGDITPDDDLIDLYHFSSLVEAHIADTGIDQAAQALTAGLENLIVYSDAVSGTVTVHGTNHYWKLNDSHGVSIFFPNDPSSYYVGSWLDFALGTNWSTPSLGTSPDEPTDISWGPMLVKFIQQTNPTGADNPTPPDLLPMPGEVNTVHLPVVVR